MSRTEVPRVPLDQAQRDAALDPERSFIVQAPAGSGKTALLTQRYLRLLATVESPEEIIAITFTNKAAAEMRSRILETLALGQIEAPAGEGHAYVSWQLARAALARDAQQGWALLRHPGRLRIQTFDAFCGALTRQMPLLSRFGAQPVTSDSPEELYREAARNALAELEGDGNWSSAVETVLTHVDNDMVRLEQLLAQMLSRRDQWLRHMADPANSRLARSELEAGLQRIVNEGLQQARALLPQAAIDELLACARYAGSNLVAAGSDSTIALCAGLTELPPADVDSFDQWRGLGDLLLTKEGWRRRLTKNEGFPAADKKNPATSEYKQRMSALLESCSGNTELEQALLSLRDLPSPTYRDEQWQVLDALGELLRLATAHLLLVFQSRGEVDFAAVAAAAVQALGTEEAPTDLALSLDYRLRHVLVDEFQDTAHGQYELLQRLTAGWERGDGRTLFCVGDPTQSIYRFREADVGLYLRARHEGIGQVSLDPLTLEVNFRSTANIVQWVNQHFAGVFPSREDLTTGAVPYVDSYAFSDERDNSTVSVWPLFDDDGTGEAQQVLQLIQQARAQDADGSIAILVRNRSHLLAITPMLRRAGLPFLSLDIEPLGHRQAVQDALALTRALLHLADRTAWLAVLRAPWCGLSLAGLHALAAGDVHASIWPVLQSTDALGRLDEDSRARVQRLVNVLQTVMADRGRGSVRRWVESAWIALGGPACVVSDAELADVAAYFDLLDELESRMGLIDLDILDEAVNGLYALPETAADERLQVMTMHKAKGLEFETVILPGLGRRPRADGRQLLLWLERSLAHRDDVPARSADLLLAPIHGAGEKENAIYHYIRELHRRRGELEDARLLYVAATRARRQLHLLGNVKTREDDDGPVLQSPEHGSLLGVLWPVVQETWRSALVNRTAPDGAGLADDDEVASQATRLRRLTLQWQLPVAPEDIAVMHDEIPVEREIVEFDWAGPMARHVGTVVHELLRRISEDGVEAWPLPRLQTHEGYSRQMLASLGVASTDLASATERVLQAVQSMLEDERGRWLLDNRHQAATSEYALTGVLDGRLVNIIIDRTFVDEQGCRWIVDYKTSLHSGGGVDTFLDREQERYREQLQRYARLMSQLEDRPIVLALYFPLLRGWRQWVYAPEDVRA